MLALLRRCTDLSLPVSPPQLASYRKQLRKLLDNGLVQPTASPYASPVRMDLKAGQPGAWRLAVDYQPQVIVQEVKRFRESPLVGLHRHTSVPV